MGIKFLFLFLIIINVTFGQSLFEGIFDKFNLQKFRNESKDLFNLQNANIFDKVNLTLKRPEIFPTNFTLKTPDIFPTNFTLKKPDILPSLPFQKKKEKPKSTKALILEFLDDLVNCIEDKKIRKCTKVFEKLIKFQYRRRKAQNKVEEKKDDKEEEKNVENETEKTEFKETNEDEN